MNIIHNKIKVSIFKKYGCNVYIEIANINNHKAVFTGNGKNIIDILNYLKDTLSHPGITSVWIYFFKVPIYIHQYLNYSLCNN
jgi:hypothetical protein